MVFCYNREVWQSTDFLSVDTESCKTMQELYQEVIDMDYKPSGVCSRLIHVELDGDKIANVEFVGGCAGNTAGISSLVKGMDAHEVIKRLEGSNNPTLEGTENKEEKIKKLLKQRDPVYEKFADIKVVTGVKPFDELIAEIEEKLKA